MIALRTAQPIFFWTLSAVHWAILGFFTIGVLVGFLMAMSATFLPPAMWQTAGLALAHERKRAGLITQAYLILAALSAVDLLAVWMFM